MSSAATNRFRASSPPPRLKRVALEAAHAGHVVFPLWPRSKKPALRDWESAATGDEDQIRGWWSAVSYNVGIATGPSGLHVVDLDDGHGHEPPPQWPQARDGRDVLARLAEAAGQPYPGDTYTVATPTGGLHLYFRAPDEPELRSTVARLGWRVDTRGAGGHIVAAGSVRPEGYYRAMNHAEIAQLPLWLVEALNPPSSPDALKLDLPAGGHPPTWPRSSRARPMRSRWPPPAPVTAPCCGPPVGWDGWSAVVSSTSTPPAARYTRRHTATSATTTSPT